MKNKLTAIKFILPVIAILIFTAVTAQSAIYVVNTTSDAGNGTCDAAECTLREAIQACERDRRR